MINRILINVIKLINNVTRKSIDTNNKFIVISLSITEASQLDISITLQKTRKDNKNDLLKGQNHNFIICISVVH